MLSSRVFKSTKSMWCSFFSGICFYVLETLEDYFLPTSFYYYQPLLHDEAYNLRVFGPFVCSVYFSRVVCGGVTSLTNSLYYRATTPWLFYFFRSAPLAPACHVMMVFGWKIDRDL
jgi:hypothetical protein